MSATVAEHSTLSATTYKKVTKSVPNSPPKKKTKASSGGGGNIKTLHIKEKQEVLFSQTSEASFETAEEFTFSHPENDGGSSVTALLFDDDAKYPSQKHFDYEE